MERGLQASYHHVRLSAIVLAFRLLLLVALPELAFSIIGSFFLIGYPTSVLAQDTSISPVLVFLTVQLVKASFEMYLVLVTALTWVNTRYYLDDHHLIQYKGIIQIEENVYELQSIRYVNHHQSWLGKLLNYGDINLTIGASGYKEDVHLRGIIEPKKYERIFCEFLGAESRQFLSPKGEPSTPKP